MTKKQQHESAEMTNKSEICRIMLQTEIIQKWQKSTEININQQKCTEMKQKSVRSHDKWKSQKSEKSIN